MTIETPSIEQTRRNGLRGCTKKLWNWLKVPRSHILRARLVLTWKNVGTEKVPKARLCALVFQDPRLATLPTSSPTLTSDGESAILQWIVNEGHLLESGDLKTAFLSGDPDPAHKGSDALYIDPPSDLRRWLKLGPEDVLRLRKAVYGLVNAPLRWHQRLSRALRPAGFVSLQMDLCVWILPASSPVKHVSAVDVPTKLNAVVVDSSVLLVLETQMDRWKRQRTVQGVLGVHVDDLVGGGNLAFQKAVQWLRTELEFGTREQSRFRFRGRELCQEYNRKSIKISMSKFAQEMEPVAVPIHVKDDMDAPLKENVDSQFRGSVGQLQWLQLQGNPLLSFATGIPATPNGHDLLSLNKLMREVKSMPDLCWWIVSVPSSFVWLTAADAAWQIALVDHPRVAT